ncbi:MAG: hypothetical protein ACI9MC_003480 [Kiritimatiellia bacterium]
MSDFEIRDDELALIELVTDEDILALAADLDLLLDAQVQRRSLVERCILALLDRAQDEGLPFSKYDEQDLEDLPTDRLHALGELMGIRGKITVRTVLKSGIRTYRKYQKNRPNSPTAMLLPSLLGPLTRAAAERS